MTVETHGLEDWAYISLEGKLRGLFGPHMNAAEIKYKAGAPKKRAGKP
ncbi:MAG: hypothetical protein ACO3PR_01320 [Limisphaerales bacterium]